MSIIWTPEAQRELDRAARAEYDAERAVLNGAGFCECARGRVAAEAHATGRTPTFWPDNGCPRHCRYGRIPTEDDGLAAWSVSSTWAAAFPEPVPR
jgi:hypothetical protein